MIDIPLSWNSFMSLDYHESTPQAVVFCSLSPPDECFVWSELTIDPKLNTTEMIAEEIVEIIGEDRKFKLTLIDPLASKNQVNTNTSVIDDLNKYFKEFKKQGRCQRIFWEVYDTKNLRGRDKIRERLRNSEKVGKPFSNTIKDNGFEKTISTIWSDKNNIQINKSFYKWRIEKGRPSQLWSHHMTALEGLMKDKRFRPKVEAYEDEMETRRKKYKKRQTTGYFKSR